MARVIIDAGMRIVKAFQSELDRLYFCSNR